ncbi:hypothetical protein ACHAWF_010924 [Thalassiosira exigua]
MDHYFNSIAKHLTDGGGGGGGGVSGGGMDNNNSGRGSAGSNGGASRSGSMNQAAISALAAAASGGGGVMQQQQQQQQQLQPHQQGVGNMAFQGGRGDLPGPLSGLPGSRQNSMSVVPQGQGSMRRMPNGMPTPLSGLPGGRQGSVGRVSVGGRETSVGNANASASGMAVGSPSPAMAAPTPQPSMQMQGMVGQPQQQQQQQRPSFTGDSSNTRGSIRSSITSVNNPFTSKEILNMLDDDIHETNQASQINNRTIQNQQQSQQQPHQQMTQQQRQRQMMMAMIKQHQQQQQQQQGLMQQNPMMPPQQQGQQGSTQIMQMPQQGSNQIQQQPQRQQQQQQRQQQQQSNNQMQQQQGSNHMQQQQQQQQQQTVNQMASQQQQQIQNFLNLHGHQLNQQQHAALQQQLASLQRQNMSSASGVTPSGGSRGQGMGGNTGEGHMNQMSGGIAGNAMSGASSGALGGSQGQVPGGQGAGVPGGQNASMDDLMLRQREQLRHLQNMIKTTRGGSDRDKAAMADQVRRAEQQQRQLNSMLQQQAQQQALQGGGQPGGQQGGGAIGRGSAGGAQRPSASSVVMQQMIQQQQQRQLQQMAQQQQQQQRGSQGPAQMTGPMAQLANQLGMQNPQQQQLQQPQDNQGGAVGRMMQQQRSSLTGQQPQPHQTQGSMSPMPIGSKGIPAPTALTSMGTGQGPTGQQQVPSVGTQPPRLSAASTSSGPASSPAASSGAAAAPPKGGGGSDSSTRVVPVSISPFAASSSIPAAEGNVGDAALIYARFAVQSIVTSLNARGGGGRDYTVRDLSTCLGAWDLNVPSQPHKRQKMDGGDDGKKSDADDGNADTAFQFYYERSCPILLDASNSRAADGSESAPTGTPLPFCVEDFGDTASTCVSDPDLPAVAGAVVLTYGADSKFTGGIGEEGVLTKAIVEFFCDEAVAIGAFATSGEGGGKDKGKKKDLDEDALVEAEEQIFARVNPSKSRQGSSGSLVQAALSALSPNPVSPKSPGTGPNSQGNSSGSEAESSPSSSDDGVYIPTIWSGNTNRIYQYCLLGNFDDNGKERASKRLCVAIQKRRQRGGKSGCGGSSEGPAQGVCRITLTLSPGSVLAKKRRMAEEQEAKAEGDSSASSEVHRRIRKSLRILRPPKLTTVGGSDENVALTNPSKRRRQALRRRSLPQLLDEAMIVVGVRCRHELLVDADEVGKVYINGALAADSGDINALPAPALFGVDLTLPGSSNHLPDGQDLCREYSALLVDALIDAGQSDADVAGKLLERLVSGTYEQSRRDSGGAFGADDYDDDGEDNFRHRLKIPFDDVSRPCLESIVLTDPLVDPVGIGAKALGTRFRIRHGATAFPCESGSGDAHRLTRVLGSHRMAIKVPRRVRDVLLRGAYLQLDQMAKFLWTGGGGNPRRSSWDGSHEDAIRAGDAMDGAIKLLREAGCKDVSPGAIRFVPRRNLEPSQEKRGCCNGSARMAATSPSGSGLTCWRDPDGGSYYVSDAVLFVHGDSIDGGEEDVYYVDSSNEDNKEDINVGCKDNKGLAGGKDVDNQRDKRQGECDAESLHSAAISVPPTTELEAQNKDEKNPKSSQIIDQNNSSGGTASGGAKSQYSVGHRGGDDVIASGSPKAEGGEDEVKTNSVANDRNANAYGKDKNTGKDKDEGKTEDKVKPASSAGDSAESNAAPKVSCSPRQKKDAANIPTCKPSEMAKSSAADKHPKEGEVFGSDSIQPAKGKMDVCDAPVDKENLLKGGSPEVKRSTGGSDLKMKEKKNGRTNGPRRAPIEKSAFLLAFYIAKEHPDPAVLERFVLSCRHRRHS